MQFEKVIELTVPESFESEVRVDLYLAEVLGDMSRSRIQKLIGQRLVCVNQEPVRASCKLKGGETLKIQIPVPERAHLEPENIPIGVVFEDAHLAVINKPAGMVVHPGAGVYGGTLANALAYQLGESLSGISGKLRPGIVHRLDRDTSGLLVVAKHDQAHQNLSEQIRAKTARRIYTALLEGVSIEDGGTVDKPIGRHPVKRKEMAIVESGRPAVSHFEVLRRFASYTLARVSLQTGRTHQIRVHMASLGLPVVGDIVYNHKKTGSLERRRSLGLTGHALHASLLSLRHPITNSLLEFEAPLPPDLQRLIDSL